jgi:hypothetical protein
MPNCGIAASGAGTLTAPSPGRLCGNGSAFVVCGTGSNGLEVAAEAMSIITHFWTMSLGTPAPAPTACNTSLPDDINNGHFATASPNAVAISPSGSPAPSCYAVPILGGASATYASSVYFPTLSAASTYITVASLKIPQAALPASGSFSIGCVIQPITLENATGGTWFTAATDTHALSLYGAYYGNGTLIESAINGTTRSYGTINNGFPYLVIYTWNGTNSRVYINGGLGQQTTDAPGYTDSTGGYFGQNWSGGSVYPYYGYLQDCFTANAAFTYAQIMSLQAGSGIP